MTTKTRGYFSIGVEGISKEYNLGNLMRSAHSFGASYFFTITPDVDTDKARVSDTSGSIDHMPYFEYPTLDDFTLPQKCALIAVELVEDAVELPSFRHPTQAAYILGAEMSSVSGPLLEKCDHVIQIPMKFCVNVGVAGALVMYDRLISTGRFPDRPVKPGGPEPEEVQELPKIHRRKIRSVKD